MIDPIEQAHSELPPSSADKWFHCHAWKRLVHGLPNESSPAAEEGTLAHEWLANHLLGVRDLAECEDKLMYDHLMMCAEWVDAQGDLQSADSTLVARCIEERVDFGAPFGYVGLTGTADVILVHPKRLDVMDLKYGRQVVEVEDNLQMLVYLVGAVHRFGRRPRYRLVVLQPRASHVDGPIREHWVTDRDLRLFEIKLDQAIEANYDPRVKPTVGDHCRKWCLALSRCPAAAKHSLSLLATTKDE